jgi:predicted nucleic acid-binding protein
MTFLADANVICEPTKSQPSAKVCAWLSANSEEIVIDAVVLGEIWDGIASMPDGKKRRDLEGWFNRLRNALPCLDWTSDSAIAWGNLKQEVRKRGYTVGIKDTMIAATAKKFGLTVATRNQEDFIRCGVTVVNPFE